MSKDRYNQIIDEAYENYVKNYKPQHQLNLDVQPGFYDPMSKEWFIKAVMEKNSRGRDFSERWGLKIEERELSWEERSKLLSAEQFYEFGFLSPFTDIIINYYLNQKNTPTKLITVTYKNKTIESYE